MVFWAVGKSTGSATWKPATSSRRPTPAPTAPIPTPSAAFRTGSATAICLPVSAVLITGSTTAVSLRRLWAGWETRALFVLEGPGLQQPEHLYRQNVPHHRAVPLHVHRVGLRRFQSPQLLSAGREHLGAGQRGEDQQHGGGRCQPAGRTARPAAILIRDRYAGGPPRIGAACPHPLWCARSHTSSARPSGAS